MVRTAKAYNSVILLLGDLIAYFFSLILTLSIRYGMIPGRDLLGSHIPSFSLLFVLFLIVSFSAGLYDRQLSFVRRGLSGLLVRVQIVNVFICVVFFYFAPVGIAPKANLFIYFIVSTILLFVWRRVMFPVVSSTKVQPAVLLGAGADVRDLSEEISTDDHYGLSFKEMIAPRASAEATASVLTESVRKTGASIIVADLHNPVIEPVMPFLYSLIFSGLVVTDAARLYESVFGRIPLSMVGERWLVENAATSLGGRRVYDSLKRAMDVGVAIIVGAVSLVLYPFVYAAIKLDDGGPIFINQDRIGRNGKPIRIIKFRSMSANDSGTYAHSGKTELKVTRIGKFIRLTRIDELPQLWNVLKGDISLIGPRPELPALVSIYEKNIPYYNIRHLIKPGLSGWAQIYHQAHPHHAVAVNDTRDKLSYDLYYVKHRSLMLDLRIALQTIKALLSRQGV